MKMLKTILTLTIILISVFPSNSQVIRNLDINHGVIKARKESKVFIEKSMAGDTIYFIDEFFEDFSNYHYENFPRPDIWTDQLAFINSSYADSMISLGVATLDAYDEYGFPYYTSTNKVTAADTLTSQIFSFEEVISDSLFFSFFYQAGGLVSMPDSIDTLFVDFLAPFDSILIDSIDLDSITIDTVTIDTIWTQVYSIGGGEQMRHFEQVIIPIDTSFITDGFRFRFRNTVSLSLNNITSQDLGKFGNADQWHLDYIQIKTQQDEHTKLNDMTMTMPLKSSLSEYTAVPYHHYPFAREILRGTIPISYRTDFPDRTDLISLVRYYYSYDLQENQLLRELQYDENIAPNGYFDEDEFFTPGFTFDIGKDTGKFEVTAVIEAQALDQKIVNDTVKHMEVYSDHYAYDDGTAELGLGIAGEYQNLNRIAVRFKVYKPSDRPDPLEAILIYFNKSIDDYTRESIYRISIRKNDGDIPASDTLYTSTGYFPDYDAKLNEFTRIELDRPIYLTDTFFVVIEQLDSYLNIGYDINNNSKNKTFFYTGQAWYNSPSLPQGSLMIRPCFGGHTPVSNEEETIDKSDKISIYPNPVTDELFINLNNNQSHAFSVRIYNIMGVLLSNSTTDKNSIDVSALERGVYIIQMSALDNREKVYTSKFIKE